MKVVALISGGKDSMLNMLLCTLKGHDLVALGHLCPATDGPSASGEELDSYCFQTVGQSHVMKHYAKCTGLPLYTQILSANSSKNQQLEYTKTDDDEVELLYELLERIKMHHPDIEGVATGAILSDYQRLRVEHVCRRAGLLSVAYLWQWAAHCVLHSIVSCPGMRTFLIKVCGLGLTPSVHLGRYLNQSLVNELRHLPHIHAAGEGGEFESLTTDHPMFLHGFLCMECNGPDANRVIHLSQDPFAPAAYLDCELTYIERSRESRVVSRAALDAWFEGIEAVFNSESPMCETPRFHPHSVVDWVASSGHGAERGSLKSCLQVKCHTASSIQECVHWLVQQQIQGLSNSSKNTKVTRVLLVVFFQHEVSEFINQHNRAIQSMSLEEYRRPPTLQFLLSRSTSRKYIIATTECDSQLDEEERVVFVQSVSYWAPHSSQLGAFSQLRCASEWDTDSSIMNVRSLSLSTLRYMRRKSTHGDSCHSYRHLLQTAEQVLASVRLHRVEQVSVQFMYVETESEASQLIETCKLGKNVILLGIEQGETWNEKPDASASPGSWPFWTMYQSSDNQACIPISFVTKKTSIPSTLSQIYVEVDWIKNSDGSALESFSTSWGM